VGELESSWKVVFLNFVVLAVLLILHAGTNMNP
jgi:hypothetical protein